MIFVTVGTQLPFDRLLDAMNTYAGQSDLSVVAQAGPGADPARWPHLQVHNHLAPPEFERLFRAAELVVAHAGIGTVLSAQRFDKPLVVVPRRADLAEHRHARQLATATRLETRSGLHVAWTTEALAELLAARHDLERPRRSPSAEQAALIRGVAEFINQS